jgi:putative oxidoreductase
MNSLRKREADALSPFHAPGGNAVLEIAWDAPKVIAAASATRCRAVSAIFSDPRKFYAADLYTFLFASLMVLVFGAGFLAVDTPVAKRLKAVE